MMNKSKFNLIIFILVFSVVVYGQDNSGKQVAQPPQVEIAGTQLLHFHSAIVNQEYDLYINLPRDYSDTSKTFPVLYLLDAQWDFPLANAIFGQQYYDGFVPGIVIVGITWGGENPNYDLLRRRDFTPSVVANQQPSGNAKNFLEFIKKELVSFIESKYRVTDDRALMGSSLGGLFTLYAMFNSTNLFNKYILTSPALQWDNGILYKIEKEFSEKNTEIPARLSMEMGGYENYSVLEQFYNILKERNYKGLSIHYKMIEGIGHSGSKADGYTRGMQFVYERPALKLDDSILEQYTGSYEFMPGINVKIDIENSHLVATTPDNIKIYLYAETENDFSGKGLYFFLHFKKDDSGKVTGFQLETYGGNQFIKKEK